MLDTIMNTIVCFGLLLLMGCLIWDLWDSRKKKPKITPSHIDQVREAAYAVIEASLQAEPQKWETILNQKLIEWIIHRESGIAIYMGGGVYSLFLMDKLRFRGGNPIYTNDRDLRYEPPMDIRRRIFTLASKIGAGSAERIEISQLQHMVAAFGHIVERNRNDQKAA